SEHATAGRTLRRRRARGRGAHLRRGRARVPQAVSRPADPSTARRPRLRGVEAFPVEHDGERYLGLRDPAGYTSSVVMLPMALLEIVSLFDGAHDVDAIQQAVLRQRGEHPPPAPPPPPPPPPH